MSNTAKGALFLVLSSISMTLMSVVVKSTGHVSIFQQVFFRNLVMAICIGILIKKENASFVGHKGNRLLLFIRSTIGFLGVLCSFYATKTLFLGDAQALLKLYPFIVTVLAVIFLKEKMTLTRTVTMIIAFLGGLIIINPRFDARLFPSIIGLFSAIFSGTAYALVSYLTKKENKESKLTIIFLFAIWSMVFSTPFMIADFNIPDIKTLVLLFLIGGFATMGQFLLTTAYSIADASKISIFDYFSIIISAIWGNLFFGEVLPSQSIIGIILIFISAFISYNNSRKQEKKE